jgi:DNA-binding transcriptional MerR regulator
VEDAVGRERLRTGEVAAKAGVNVQTLRYYERRGILREPRRTSSGYREYPSETVRVIRFVKRAQELGFTLGEIEELLRLRESRAGRRERVRARAAAKLRDIDERIRDLRAVRGALTVLLDSCRCAGTPECPILEALDDEGAPREKGAKS